MESGRSYVYTQPCGCVFTYDDDPDDSFSKICVRPCDEGQTTYFFDTELLMTYVEFQRYCILQGHKTVQQLTNL